MVLFHPVSYQDQIIRAQLTVDRLTITEHIDRRYWSCKLLQRQATISQPLRELMQEVYCYYLMGACGEVQPVASWMLDSQLAFSCLECACEAQPDVLYLCSMLLLGFEAPFRVSVSTSIARMGQHITAHS